MENNLENILDDFVVNPEEETTNVNAKTVILNKREGLIERVDKILVVEDGRQLLREQY